MPEYKIELLNKNKKIIKKVENIERIEKNSFKPSFNKRNFNDKKFNKNFKIKNKFKKKFRFHAKTRKNNFEKKVS